MRQTNRASAWRQVGLVLGSVVGILALAAWTSRAEAPSAMRIPISCVRWFTEYEIRA